MKREAMALGTLVLLALLSSLMIVTLLNAQFSGVRVQVIDRGQADGILIRTPNQEWVVIDAGTNGQQAAAMRDEWGVDDVALAVVSHRHFDHQGGMDEIINAFDVDLLVMNSADCPGRSSDNRVIDAARARGTPLASIGPCCSLASTRSYRCSAPLVVAP